VQIICGCADGRARVFQLTSDAPAAAAIHPRAAGEGKNSPTGANATSSNAEAEEEALAAKLTGAVLVLEVDEVQRNPREPPAPCGPIVAVFPVAETPLWVIVTHGPGPDAHLKSTTVIKVFDLDVGVVVGQILPPPQEPDNQSESGSPEPSSANSRDQPPTPQAAAPMVFVRADGAVIIIGDTTIAARCPIVEYASAFFPPIARASRVKVPGSPKSPTPNALRQGSPADTERVTEPTPAQMQCVLHLLAETEPQERCNSRADLTYKLPRSPKVRTSPLSSPLGSPAALGLSFSSAGMIAAKMRLQRDQAKRNIINPTRLNESLDQNLPTDKMADFESRRLRTRQDRHELLEDRLKRWMTLATAAATAPKA